MTALHFQSRRRDIRRAALPFAVSSTAARRQARGHWCDGAAGFFVLLCHGGSVGATPARGYGAFSLERI